MNYPIPQEFIDKFPKQKHNQQLQSIFNKYIEFTKNAYLIRSSNNFNINLTQLKNSLGYFSHENNRYFYYQEFQKLKETQLYVIIQTGDNLRGITTMVRPTNKLLELVDILSGQELVEHYYGNLTDEEKDLAFEHAAPIDLLSLEAYIVSTEQAMQSNESNTALYNKLDSNIKLAKQIYKVAEYLTDDTGSWLLQIVNQSAFGRTYYKGLNLQSAPKEVRNAALGKHYQYDLNASSYTMRLAMVSDIYKQANVSMQGEFTYTKDYLDRKDAIRNELAKHIKSYSFNQVELIKQILTAIGFGAKLNAGAWQNEKGDWVYPAISSIIKNKEDREAVLNDPWMIQFMHEQELMSEIIVTYYKEFHKDAINAIPELKSQSGRINNNKLMAYLYQQWESKLITAITNNLYSSMSTKIKPILLIHDGFATRQKIDMGAVLLSAESVIGKNPFKLELTEVNAWYNPTVTSAMDNTATEEQQHKARIAYAEQQARGYKSDFVDKSYNDKPFNVIDRVMITQQYDDLPDYEYELPSWRE